MTMMARGSSVAVVRGDKPADTRVTRTKAVIIIDEILPDRHRVAPAAHRLDDQRAIRFARCLRSLKTLLMSGEGPSGPRRRQRLGLATRGRFSAVHQWPVLGVHRGYRGLGSI